MTQVSNRDQPPSFGPILREQRLRQGLTAKQVAEHIGVPHSMLSDWEAGTGTPSLRRATYWCELLGYELWPREVKDGSEAT